MALPGREPNEHRVGHSPRAEWVNVADEPYDGPHPDLPAHLMELSPLVEWWNIVTAMPHCRLWSTSDWQFALDTARMKKAFYGDKPSVNLATELRRREDDMGMTREARRKLRIRYVDAEEATASKPRPVSRLDARRRAS